MYNLAYISFFVCVFFLNLVEGKKAECKMDGTNGSEMVNGTIMIEQKDKDSEVKVDYDLMGFEVADASMHGFHIHEKGDLGSKCVDALGHYNPYNKTHGGMTAVERHVGDLGNIEVAGGKSKGTLSGKFFSLYDTYSVIGRAFVVHEGEDDLGKGDEDDSQITGNAGARLQCCVIMESSAITATSSIFVVFTAIIISACFNQM